MDDQVSGRTFEELEVGDAATIWRTVTPADVLGYRIGSTPNARQALSGGGELVVARPRVLHGSVIVNLVTELLGNCFPGDGSMACPRFG